MIDFTVVIPTYNGASRVPDVLEKLRSQTGTENIAWEIIVVDNNSSDQTADLVQNLIASWQEVFPLKYVFEAKQGIAFARQRGVEVAKGELIGFLDDDNFPNSDWILQAYLFGQEHPKAGSYGGQIHANYQVEPPENFKRIEHLLLAIRESGDQPFLFCPEQLKLPSGAGLVVRREAWFNHFIPELVDTGRGDNDYEISIHFYNQGWEIWYNHKMHINHYIPRERLEKKYLLRLADRYGLFTFKFRSMLVKNWQQPIIFLRVFLGSMKRVIQHLLKYKHHVNTNLVTACELRFFWKSALSPFYFILLPIINSKKSGQ
ncbi:hormogonium polysaccharide biosynthesis glycosyltransferase HpsE [Planktothrix agardhii 1801]|jgi:glycosyltransferase involved in cell wall biosynthesis|uniref:hormogonium polysaccharide biosynthesis glycosyltransferase HpsE n=1 Tax=Planktothrix agardhii TaxID=1160 RepID=UPI001F2D884A|nr:hormogonium polysaccharide biosynthesis glycosyltransferase HpsE [Planktothrix agardhii]MCF3623620.1 hormogonium polysaccharide biosynthesis glycosyltransferase HpsE [Planktothrix agardhii 1801]